MIDNEGVKTHQKARTWVFDWKSLCNHFGIELDDGDDTQRRIPECIPEAKICDLDAEAQEFVAHYLDAALLATPEASQSGWDLERDLEDEAAEHPLVKSVLDSFPGAKLTTVTPIDGGVGTED